MPNNSSETNDQPVERSTEQAPPSESAESAYREGAPTNLRDSQPNTADQHLNSAKISDDAIDFGPPPGCVAGGDSYRTDDQNRNIYQHRDSDGRLTEESMTNPDGSGTARQYGADGSRTETIWDKDNNSKIVKYDETGQKSSQETRWADGQTDRYRYSNDGSTHYSQTDSSGRLKEESIMRRDGSGESREYREDGERTERSWDQFGRIQTTQYDAFGRRVRN